MTSFPGGEGSKAKVSSVGVRGMNVFWNYTLLHIALINQVAQFTKPCKNTVLTLNSPEEGSWKAVLITVSSTITVTVRLIPSITLDNSSF